jgi:hypothetical protein
VCDSAEATVAEVELFYRVYDSMRFVGEWLVLRVQRLPDAARLAELNARFGGIVTAGRIEPTEPLREEVSDRDRLDLARLRLRFDRRHWSELRRLIDAINES